MDKKIKKSDINLLIMVAGVLIAVASYFLVYTNFTEQTATLESENATLQTEVDELQKLADNKQFYLDETDRMNEEINDIMAKYPAEVRPEEEILYAVNLENTNSIWVNSIMLDTAYLVQTAASTANTTQDSVDGDDTTSDAVEATSSTPSLSETVFLYGNPYTIGFKTTYRSIKDIVQSIVTNTDRRNIQALSLAYDSETGCLSGTLEMTMYSMTGTGKVAEDVDISGVKMGTSDFFQSGTVLSIQSSVSSSDDTEDADAGDADSEDEE